MSRILVINPGGTSTKVALFEDDTAVFSKTVIHPSEELKDFGRVMEQHAFRTKVVEEVLKEAGIAIESVDIVMARGGLAQPMEGGVYEVTDDLIADMRDCRYGEHASNLGALIARDLAERAGVHAYIMDPVSVDEMDDVARITGLKEISRVSLLHALNSRAMARAVADELHKPYEALNMVTAHLGAGISIIPHRKGKMIDCNNPMEMGPFCPDRAGGLPSKELAKLCFSGKYEEQEFLKKMTREGGLNDHLGTKDLRVAEKMAADGDEYADLVLSAMSYQIAKEIGAMATALTGDVDAIVLTGGMAHSERMVKEITERVQYIAPVFVKAGEYEMEALAGGGQRVLTGTETSKPYERMNRPQ